MSLEYSRIGRLAQRIRATPVVGCLLTPLVVRTGTAVFLAAFAPVLHRGWAGGEIERWYRIVHGEKQIGYSRYQQTDYGKDAEIYSRLRIKTTTQRRTLFREYRLETEEEALVSRQRGLLQFRIVWNEDGNRRSIEGSRVGDAIEITTSTGGKSESRRILLSSFDISTYDFGLRLSQVAPFSVGKTYSIRVFDPLESKSYLAKIKAVEKRLTTVRGAPALVDILEIQFSNYSLTMWVTEDGAVVKEQGPDYSSEMVDEPPSDGPPFEEKRIESIESEAAVRPPYRYSVEQELPAIVPHTSGFARSKMIPTNSSVV